MRSIWTGSISFGLVNIPVRMYSGIRPSHGLDLDMLHREDKEPIRYARVCRADGKEIPWDEIVKGYEYRDGDYVVLTKEDFEKADKRETNSLSISQFTDEEEIDVRYYEKPYWLEPDKKAGKAYGLLHKALAKSKKVAVVKFVMRGREHLGVIKPVGRALVLNQLRFSHDLRDAGDLKFPSGEDISNAELEMALSLIKQQTEHFVPEDFHDTYTEKLEEVIEEKAKGHKPKTVGKKPAKTDTKDLMAALKASLEKS